MLFHTLQFTLFFAAVFFINLLLVNGLRLQTMRKWFLLLASLQFYCLWNPALVSLLIFCILTNFYCGLRVYRSQSDAIGKRWLSSSVVVNLGILAIFKYLDFGVQSAAELARAIGFQVNPGTFDLILPLGISFFTFQALGYVIDIYRGKYAPYDSLRDFALFVAFFPQLIAGPIVRADFFAKSLRIADHPITLKNTNNGLFLLVVGIFKKAVLADNSAHIANMAFADPGNVSSLIVVLGVLAFSAQIYFDFSGYTDMARGLGRMLGVELPENFKRPYLARGIRDFWKRWHISLSTWLRDYLYISLGGSRAGTLKTYRNLFVTMLLGGLWHGSSMNFVIWGGMHGCLLTMEHYLSKHPALANFFAGRAGPLANLLLQSMTLMFVCLTWIFFRSPDFDTSTLVLTQLCSLEGYTQYSDLSLFKPQNWLFGLLLPLFYIFVVERISFDRTDQIPPFVRASIFWAFLGLILLVSGKTNEFIYFQF